MTTKTNTSDFADAFEAGSLLAVPRFPLYDNEGGFNAAGLISKSGVPYVIVPPGCSVDSLERLLPQPVRKRGKIVCTDAPGFIGYLKKHAELEFTMIYAMITSEASVCILIAVLDDHGFGVGEAANWREHICRFSPSVSVEWTRWASKDRKVMPQVEFAAFLEDNRCDVASVEGMPDGAQILEMALAFEATAEKRLRSKINLGNGGISLEYVDEENDKTRTSMRFFERFTIGLPVFEGSRSAYPLEARLKYRNNSGKLSFWFELVRPDKVFKAAVDEIVAAVAEETGLTIIAGNPGLA